MALLYFILKWISIVWGQLGDNYLEKGLNKDGFEGNNYRYRSACRSSGCHTSGADIDIIDTSRRD